MSTRARQQAPPLTGRAYLRVVLIAAAIGIPAALLAALFLALVHYMEKWLWTDLPDALGHSSPPWYLILGLPVLGAAVVLAARRLLPGDGGHPPLEGLSMKPTPLAYAPSVALAALGTLGFGAVLGPDRARVRRRRRGHHAGAARRPREDRARQRRVVRGDLGPLRRPNRRRRDDGRGRRGLGAALIPALLPGFVAAGIGYVIFVGFGNWGGLNAPGLAVPALPAYNGTHIYDLAIAVVVGVVAALVLAAVRSGASEVAERGSHGLSMPALLLTGGLAVGVTALVADALGAPSPMCCSRASRRSRT